MKNTLTLLFIMLITYGFGQSYNINDVSPNIIKPGQINNVTVTLNKALAEGDSILNAELWVYFSDYIHDTLIYSSSLETVDSLIHITFDFPDKDFVSEGFLYLNMKITNYYDSISIKGIKIGEEISFVNPEICIVQVDTSSNNLVLWEKPSYTNLDSVYIYRETSVLNEFEKIGVKSFDEISIFKDTTSIPEQNSNRYMISFIDTSGAESPRSEAHKTIHLSINEAFGGAINLAWNNYEGFYYSTFHIYRGLSKSNMIKIADIASNLYSFSDIMPPLGNLYYQVIVTKTDPCIITGLEPGTETLNSSKSNFQVYNTRTNIDEYDNKEKLNLYPNPAKDDLFIQLNNQLSCFEVAIYDLTGRLVRIPSIITNGSTINISYLQKGLYIVKIFDSNTQLSEIIAKE